MSFNFFQDSMSELRALCYPGTDVLMLCFSVVRPETFRSVAERWTRAVDSVNAPLILVGTQCDLALDGRVIQTLKVSIFSHIILIYNYNSCVSVFFTYPIDRFGLNFVCTFQLVHLWFKKN